MTLHEAIAVKVAGWRSAGYPSEEFAAIAEILEWARGEEESGNVIRPIHNQSQEVLDFPTQKPEALIRRIITTSSRPNDIVLDCFAGSGTTLAVAQRLGRRWIGCDINKGAIQTTAKRVQTIMRAQAKHAACLLSHR